MKSLSLAVAGMLLFVGSAVALAGDVESGLKTGKMVGAFYVTKLAGAEDDGINVGKNLCYRCKNGGRPQVMIFTRSSDENVVKLVKKLDAAIPKNSKDELRAFVNYLGENKATAKHEAEKLAARSQAKHVPFVLPNEFENGPEDYGINPNAEVTIIMAEGGKVKANHAVAKAKELEVDAVIADLKKILQ